MRKFLIFLLLLISVVCIGVSVFFLINPEPEGQRRQAIEESIAVEYLAHLELKNTEQGPSSQVMTAAPETTTEKETEKPTEKQTEAESGSEEETVPESASASDEAMTEESSEEETETESEAPTSIAYNDVNYYTRDGVTYTPDYARGKIIGVLEVPTAKIRRGIYGGTREDIAHDLDIWMVTEAHPDYVLGDTHFCIYGHNHTVQDLSFNNLKNVKPGDTFTITNEDGVWVYDVTDFFAEWREIVTTDYVDNFSLPKDKCYIITCGRDEYRYKDIVVVGTLRHDPRLPEETEEPSQAETSSAAPDQETEPETEAETGPEELSTETETEEETTEKATEPLEDSTLKLSYDNEKLTVRLVDDRDKPLSARMALVDEDGLFVEEWDEAVHTIQTELPFNTEYLISVFSPSSMPEGYSMPKEVVFNLKASGSFHEEQLTPNQDDIPRWALYGIGGLAILLVLMMFGLVIGLMRKRSDD